jgi:hypothetical protein
MITFQLISEKNEKMKESDKKDNEKMNNELMGSNNEKIKCITGYLILKWH